MKNFFKVSYRAAFVLTLVVFFGTAQSSAAQTIQPTIRIVVPERFRVLTNQFFDLRIEAENLAPFAPARKSPFSTRTVSENQSTMPVNTK